MIGAAAIALCAAVFFVDGLFSGTRTLVWDAADYAYPLMAYVAHAFREGVVPLWNPFVLNGYPAIGDTNTQVFYPINWILAGISEFTPHVVYVQLVVHYVLAGVSMFALCRHYGNETAGAVLGGLVFMFSGFMVGHLQHHSMLATASWLPLVVLCLELALDRRQWRFAVWGGVALAMSLLAGHSQSTFYILVVLSVYWIYRTTERWLRNRKVSVLARDVGLGALMGVVALGIAAVQLLPAAEFVLESNRAGGRVLEMAGRGIPPSGLASLLAPNYFGGISGRYWGTIDISQQNLFMGTPTLALAVLAVLAAPSPRVFFWTVMAGGSLLVAMGTATPLFPVLYHTFPGFGLFRQVVHSLFVFHFFCALLAAEGATRLWTGEISWRMRLGAVGAVGGVAVVVYVNAPPPPTPAMAAQASTAIGGFLVGLVATGILFVVTRARISITFQALWVAVTFLEIWVLTGESVTIGRLARHYELEAPPQAVAVVKKQAGIRDQELLYRSTLNLDQEYLEKGLFRIYVSDGRHPFRIPEDTLLLGVVGFNRALVHKVFSVDGYTPIVLKRHQNFAESLVRRNRERFLRLTSAKYDITIAEDKAALSLVPDVLPRALIVPRAEVISDPQNVLDRLADPLFDPFASVVIEEHPSPPDVAVHGVSDSTTRLEGTTVVFKEYGPNRISIEATTSEGGYLLLNDSYDPGWKVSVDGRAARVFRANYLFRAVPLTPGAHELDFVFQPRAFRVGLTATLATISTLFVAWLVHRYRMRRQGTRGSTGRRKRGPNA